MVEVPDQTTQNVRRNAEAEVEQLHMVEIPDQTAKLFNEMQK